MPNNSQEEITSEDKISANILAGEVINYRDSWRIFRIITEFVEGLKFVSK